MNGKLGKRYVTICIVSVCVMLGLMLLADYRGIFDSPAAAGNIETTETGIRESDEQIENEKSFCLRDQSLEPGMMEVSLPFPAEEKDVSVGISVADGNVMQIIISKESHLWSEESGNSLSAYLHKVPVRENLPESEVRMQLAETDDALTLYWLSDQLYDGECSIMRNEEEKTGILQVRMVPVRERYDKIVVLDAGHGGEDTGFSQDGMAEKDLTLSVVRKTGELFEQAGVQVYYTRTADEPVAQEMRAALANKLRADMLISIHVAQEEDSSRYGIRTKYNDTFFIPDFSSADLSYILLEKVAASTNEKALGIEADTQEAVVRQAEVPVALLEIGYLSNAQERKLLEKEDYIERIAQGIFDALMQSYEEMKS